MHTELFSEKNFKLERRIKPRLNLNGAVLCGISLPDYGLRENDFLPGIKVIVGDISIQGIRIQIVDSLERIRPSNNQDSIAVFSNPQQEIKKGSSIDLSLALWENKKIEISGKIKWIKSATFGKIYDLGIGFDLSDRDRKLISRLLAYDQITEWQKIEYQARSAEIRQYADNAFKITLGMISASIGSLGLALVAMTRNELPYLYILPLLVIQMGFGQYVLQLKRIRRMGNYIRCFLEEETKDLQWEERIANFRNLSHSVMEDKDRDKFYSLGYYCAALWLASIAFIFGAIRIFNLINQSINSWQLSDWLYSGVFIIVANYWFFYRNPKLREQSKDYEGGGKLDRDMLNLWQRVKAFQEGICKNTKHFEIILQALWKQYFAEDFEEVYINGVTSTIKIRSILERESKDDSRQLVFKNLFTQPKRIWLSGRIVFRTDFEQQLKKLENKLTTQTIKNLNDLWLNTGARLYNNNAIREYCDHSKRCNVFRLFQRICDNLGQDLSESNKIILKPTFWFCLSWGLMGVIAISMGFFLARINLLHQVFIIILWPWLLIILLILIKVRIKRIYWADKPRQAISKVIKLDKLVESLTDEEKELFPADYINPRIKSLFVWIFYYGKDKTWGREKGYWSINIGDWIIFKKENTNVFCPDMWH
jgi:hypothetical protein